MAIGEWSRKSRQHTQTQTAEKSDSYEGGYDKPTQYIEG